MEKPVFEKELFRALLGSSGDKAQGLNGFSLAFL